MAYLIKVHDDGDTEIRQVDTVPDMCPYLELYRVEDVARELKDYGFDEDRINEALDRVSSEVDWVQV